MYYNKNMKTKILGLIVLFTLTITNTAFALTQADVDFLIAAGFIAPENAATARAAVTSSNTTTTNATRTTTATNTNTTSSNYTDQNGCIVINSDLVTGMSGSAVTALQKFLKSQNLFSADATGYYGAVTQGAVEAFQKAQGIVLNGTPETTGLGKVGPTTRNFIANISCGTTTGTATTTPTPKDFFGYNLDELFNYSVDTSYSSDFNYDSNFSYQPFSSYVVNTNYSVDDYEVDWNYKVGSSYQVDSSYGSENNISVLLFAKAVNGQHLRGGNKLPVAVSSKNIELKWVSENADTCALTGDYKDARLNVPTAGTANLTVTSSSYSAPNGAPLHSFKVTCSNSKTRSLAGSDTVLVWVTPASTTPVTQ